MFIYIPQELLYLLLHFEGSFTKGIFAYFVGYIWGLLTGENKKVVTNIKRSCFFIKKSISSWERFVGVQKWNNHSGNADAGQYICGHHWGLLGMVGKFFDKKFLCFPLLMRIITGKKANWQWIAGEKGIEKMKIGRFLLVYLL